MSLQNAFGALSLDTTSQAIRDRLPALLDGDGGLKVHIQNQTSGSVDVTDRVGRLLGHVIVDSGTVTVSNPFSGDITDRTGRLLGHINIDGFPADTIVTGTFASAGDRVNIAVGHGGVVGVYISGTYTTLTTAMDWSIDGGSTWPASIGGFTQTGAAINAGQGIANNGLGLYYFAAPPGATHLSFRAVTLASGSVNIRLGYSPNAPLTGVSNAGQVTTNAILQTGSSKIGRFAADGVWQDDTATPLAGNGTFTGATRDLAGTSSGGQWTGTSGSWGSVEIRGRAVSDVVGTLFLEVSRDNFVTSRRIKAVALSNVGTDSTGTGAVYVAEILHRPATRYARWVFVNGAGAQTYFELQTFLISA